MKNIMQSGKAITVLTVLRVIVGWHFLYEGIAKLVNPNWSAAAYLMESKWLFSGFFHWIIANPTILNIVDFLNIWGLIFIGLGLFVGLFTRTASYAGILLLMLYYVANPPFVHSSAPSEGHYFIVNKNLIEAAILLLFALMNKESLWGIDRLLSLYTQKRKNKTFPEADNHDLKEFVDNPRRELLKNLVTLPVMGAAFFGVAKKHGWISFEEKNLKAADAQTSASVLFTSGMDIKELKAQVPHGNIKDNQISRIIVGGNLVSGFAHSRDLIYVSSILKKYFTDEKVIETLWLCEACGINTALLRTDENTIRILDKYWKRGGKIQWLAQTYPKENDFTNVQMAIDHGAMGAFCQGAIADTFIRDNKLDVLEKTISFIKSKGIIAGTAAHSLQVPIVCEKSGLDLDFYMKTLHHDKYWSAHPKDMRIEFNQLQPNNDDHNRYHDNIWCINPEETVEFFKNVTTPMIAYKVLAAGAINPQDGLQYVFSGGADFACIGMFDFQVVENANITNDILSQNLSRERKWYA